MAGSERPAQEAVPGLPTHPSQISELVRDAGRYLIGDGTCDAARKLVGAQAFRHAQPDFEAFVDSQRDATEVVRVDLEVKGQGRHLHSVYTLVPGPLTLLLICARNCRDGDRVVLRQHTAKCGDMCHEARWPFDVAEAERMTRPASGVFDELARAGAHRVRSRDRTLGPFGMLQVRLEHHDRRVRMPRLMPWLGRRPRRGIGVRWRWRGAEMHAAWLGRRRRA